MRRVVERMRFIGKLVVMYIYIYTWMCGRIDKNNRLKEKFKNEIGSK